MGKLLSIPWWSLPFFVVGMYFLYIGQNQGLVLLCVTALMAFVLRFLDYKFKRLMTIPFWCIPFFGIGLFDLLNDMVNPGIILFITTGSSLVLFLYLVYKFNKTAKIICPKCKRETWAYKDGKLPTVHRSGQCKTEKFEEPRKKFFT